MIKKSFRDSNISYDDADNEKANVTVNGYLISERIIKKAEKLAGPIQPGHYWYVSSNTFSEIYCVSPLLCMIDLIFYTALLPLLTVCNFLPKKIGEAW